MQPHCEPKLPSQQPVACVPGGSSLESILSSLTVTMIPRNSARYLGCEQDLASLLERWRDPSNGRAHVSLPRTSTIVSASSLESPSFAKSNLVDYTRGSLEIPVWLLSFLFFLLTTFHIGPFLRTAVIFFQRCTLRVPCLLRFHFIQVVLSFDFDHLEHTSGCNSSESSQADLFLNLLPTMEVESKWPESRRVLSPVMTTGLDDSDDYGYFADFDDCSLLIEETLLSQSQRSLSSSASSALTSLCTLEEMEAEE